MRICLRCGDPIPAGGTSWTCGSCGWRPLSADRLLLFAPELDGNSDGFREESFEYLRRMEERHFWFSHRNRVLLGAFDRFFPEAGSLLEVGCGNGFVLGAFAARRPGIRLTGTDVFSAPLRRLGERMPDAEVAQMDGRALPYRQEFDVVGAFDVIEHIDEDEEVLRQMAMAARPGGGVMITVPQHEFLWSEVDEFACHRRRYSRAELVEKMARAGISLLYVSSFVTTLLPVMLLSRLRQRREYDPGLESAIPGWLNGLLGAALAVERPVLARGLSLPFGGSLVAVGRVG